MAEKGLSLSVEIQSDDLKLLLKTMEKKGQDLTPLFKKFAILMTRSFADNFRQEGRPKKWKALSKNTVAGRRKGSSRILQDTGMLRQSVLARSAAGNIRKFSKDSLKMGSRHKTAAWHQRGTRPYTIVPKNKQALSFMTTSGRVFAKKVNHPGLVARPFIMIQTEDEKAMAELALDHMTGE
jgi:phage gpG-like protein